MPRRVRTHGFTYSDQSTAGNRWYIETFLNKVFVSVKRQLRQKATLNHSKNFD